MKQIELANGKGFALVDDEDYEWLSQYKWSLSTGYAGRSDKMIHRRAGKRILMHREILGLKPGDGKEVDHINGNRLDNQRANLRIATHQENHYNKRRAKGRTSKYKGVIHRPGGQWAAQISSNKIGHYLGLFEEETEAAIAYDNEARKMFGEFAALNFPDINRPARGRFQLMPKGTSKYFGVSWRENRQKWVAKINEQGKTIHLGIFENELDAAHAFDEAVRKYRGEKARANFS